MAIKCKVKSIQQLAANTYQILLIPEIKVVFKAGQYLLVNMGEQDKRPFSIASSPNRHKNELELHIGAAEHNVYAIEVVQLMQTALVENKMVDIDAPYGDAWLREESKRPLLLIAGGTGFSYVRSIVDHCLEQQTIDQDVYLYWGAKDPSQLYANNEMLELAKKHPQLHFIPVVEQPVVEQLSVVDKITTEQIKEKWDGKIGNVLEAVNHDFDSLVGFDIYIAGRFEMANAARELFVQKKAANIDNIFADAFAFS